MRVAVLSGGRSSEHDVSLRSGAAVARGLRGAGHEVVEVTIARDGALERRRRAGGADPGRRACSAPTRSSRPCTGAFGEDGSVQGLLEWLDVPYVGSDVLASAICMDKLTLKRLFAEHGDPAGRLRRGRRGAAGGSAASELGLPLWVKPSRMGSSVGITRVERPRPSSTRRSSWRCATTRG